MVFNAIENLQKIGPLITREEAWLSRDETMTKHLEQEKLGLALEVLSHTLAAVKPNVHNVDKFRERFQVTSDTNSAEKIFALVKPPLDIIFQVSLNPTSEDLDSFYPGLARQIGESHYKLYYDIMLSGPVTYILLFSKTGNAVEEWRSQIGSTDPKSAAPGTIRNEYGDDIQKNLVHGSASIPEAKREFEWLKSRLQQLK